MQRIILPRWTFPVLTLFLVTQVLFTGQVLISRDVGSTGSGTTAAYWSNCVNLSRQQVSRSQNPEPPALDSCYLSLLAKYSSKFLNDISTNPFDFFTSLQQMKEKNQQPSVVQLFIQLGAKGYSSVYEKQELTSVDSNYVDQGKTDPKVVAGYNAAIDRPLFDQFVKQQLPTFSSQRLDQWFTNVILTIPAVMKQTCDARQPHYTSPPSVNATLDAAREGDVTYHSGKVVDGIANLYLIFWIDDSFQPASPKYVSVVTQFVKDIGQSPLYANLLQYRDALGRCPTGGRLVGTFIDKHPFPQDLVQKRKDPNASSKPLSDQLEDLTLKLWVQEIESVAAKKEWNTKDYHNVFILLPTMNWGCGWHLYLTRDAAPYAYGSYPFYQGQEQCAVVPQSPNNDHVADIATGILSHEIMETISDPFVDGWYTKDDTQETADKCPLPPSTINPQTNGNVTWNGHHYAIQEEYDNLRHGCVLEGP